VRLFVAVETGAAVARAAVEVIEELRRRAARVAPGVRFTWTAPERLHLTLRFIGEADAPGVQAIRTSLDSPVDVPPFEMSVGGIGVFPPGRRPRALWVGVGEGLESVHRLEREVTRRLRAAGVPPEARPFSPHCTLARVRPGPAFPLAPLVEGLTATVLGTTRVEAITLFESRLSPKGPDHVPLQRTPLVA
jgi:2'-5' RNA ligase